MAVKPGVKVARVVPDRPRQANSSYLALVNAHPLRPIRSEKDLERATAVLENLLTRKKPLTSGEKDYCEILGREIERYENAAYPMPDVSPVAVLKHLIEAREGTLSEVANGTGIAVSTLSAILNGKRQLNIKHIQKLAPFFGVPESTFVGQSGR